MYHDANIPKFSVTTNFFTDFFSITYKITRYDTD